VRWLTLTAWVSMLVFAAASALPSVSLKQIGVDMGVSFGLKGALAQARAAALALSTFVVGCLGDRFGKRPFLGCGMAIVALALLAVAASRHYVALAAGMTLMGIGLGSLEALASPLVAQLHPRRVGTHMNVLHGFFPAGTVACSLGVGVALVRGVHWRTAFAVAALPAALVGLMFLAGRYPRADAGPRVPPLPVRRILADRAFWLLAVAMALTAGCEGSLIFWSPNFIQHEFGASALVGAWGLTAFSAAMALGRFGTGAALKLVRVEPAMVALAALGSVATLIFMLASDVRASVASLALAGVCVACFWPSILTLATRRIAADSARLLAMLAVAGIVGFGTVPLAVGLVAERFQLRTGLALLPAALAAAALVLLSAVRSPETTES